MDTEKECSECHEVKQLEEFYKNPTGKFGRDANCKACKKALRAVNNAKNKVMNESATMAEIWARTPNKGCCECKKTLPSTMFDRSNRAKSGLQDICRECRSVVGTEFRERYARANSLISIDELRRRTPRRRCCECKKTLPSTMFERCNTDKNGLQTKCRECNAITGKLHREANPEAYRAKNARRRAKEKGLFLEDFTYSQIVERDGAEACAYCHTTEGPFDVDHIFPLNLNGWHTPDNLVLACASHNRSKGAVHPAIYIKREGHSPNQTILRALALEHELTHSSTEEEAATCA